MIRVIKVTDSCQACSFLCYLDLKKNMIGNLTDTQIELFLQNEVVGRIGCLADNMVYIVPISYAYDKGNVYAHTFEGKKLDAMRKNPDVCFEVDDIKIMGNWKSVIAWGKFEELTDAESKRHALQLLLNRQLPTISSITTHLGSNWPFLPTDINKIEGVVFKIALSNSTGKYESTMESPSVLG